jgi:hypothetical protein
MMKKTTSLLAVMVLLGGSLIAAQQPDKQKESYLKKADGQVQDWSTKLKALQERSEKSGEETRQELNQHIKVVDEKLDEARKKIDELRASSEGAWQSLQKNIDKTLHEVKRDYQKAVSFFNKTETKKKEKKS